MSRAIVLVILEKLSTLSFYDSFLPHTRCNCILRPSEKYKVVYQNTTFQSSFSSVYVFVSLFDAQALGGGYLHWGHIEMIRLTINRKMDSRTTFAHWCINGPYKPITRKGLGQRMGGGKGAIDHYVTPVRYGRLIVEMGGKVELGEVEHILIEVAKKLPFPAKVR